MTHPVDAMLAEAEDAIRRMKRAAEEARRLHARAELGRHMRTTAAKLSGMPADEAAAAIAREWMNAWSIDGGYPALTQAVADFSKAFSLDARGSNAATQAAIAGAFVALEEGFGGAGTTLADEMAFRSECAHGWWSSVAPIPEAFKTLRRAPPAGAASSFWEAGPQPHCLPRA